MIACLRLGSVAGAVAAALAGLAPDAAAQAPKPPRPVLDSPFFPFTYIPLQGLPERLAELGYAPFTGSWNVLNLDKEPPAAAAATLSERLKTQAAKGPGVFWVSIRYGKDNPAAGESAALEVARQLGDAGQAAGWRVSIYPHTGDSLFTARQTLPFVQKVSHPNVGLTLNLAHELRNGQGPDLLAIVDEIRAHLDVVTINGADNPPGPGPCFWGWDRLIQPLGRGDHDVYPLLRKLREIGFTGPIGLQCFNIKLPTLEHLTASMEAWRAMLARLEKDKE